MNAIESYLKVCRQYLQDVEMARTNDKQGQSTTRLCLAGTIADLETLLDNGTELTWYESQTLKRKTARQVGLAVLWLAEQKGGEGSGHN